MHSKLSYCTRSGAAETIKLLTQTQEPNPTA